MKTIAGPSPLSSRARETAPTRAPPGRPPPTRRTSPKEIGDRVRQWGRLTARVDTDERELSYCYDRAVLKASSDLVQRKARPAQLRQVRTELQPVARIGRSAIVERRRTNHGRDRPRFPENAKHPGPSGHCLPSRSLEEPQIGGLIHVPVGVTVVRIDGESYAWYQGQCSRPGKFQGKLKAPSPRVSAAACSTPASARSLP